MTPFITNDLLLRVIRFLKFESGRTAVPLLSWWIAASIERYDRSLVASDAAVVPIPLHRVRRIERGYNQAELIAREVASILRIKVDKYLLRRKKKTKPQSKLSASGRRLNVEKAFTAEKDDLRPGRDIILIDDLITTGETARACVRALQEVSLSAVMVAAAGRSR
ncbi:MAG: ComF family protein [Candidatus Krumholzibacteriota bacterium]|nr:ComF family protein [Candidatus Krumholzibacteriota bacterium]